MSETDPAEAYLARLPPKRRQQPRSLLTAAVLADSTSRLDAALRAARDLDDDDDDDRAGGSYDAFLVQALSAAIKASSESLVSHLVEQQHAPAARLSPSQVAQTSSTEIITVILSAGGYDVNRFESTGYMRGRRLLDHMCCDDVLVRLLLDHGARPDLPLPDGVFDEDEVKPESLLERVAGLGSVGSFRLLRDGGAPLGIKTLHKAAKSAAQVGADPKTDEDADGRQVRVGNGESDESWKAHRGPMLRLLLDEVGLDVNAMDVREGETVPNTYGPAINWAAREAGGAKVVSWLLERGADPHIKDCTGIADARGWAEQAKNDSVMEVLDKWEKARA